MNLDLELYRTFQAVARQGSISRAAQELCVTQPAVSQAVKALEQALGAQLFVRGAKGVTLTAEGEMLRDYVDKAMGLIDAAQRQFAGLRELERGLLRIGASDTLCKHYLLGTLEEFHRRYPRVKLQVTNRTSRETVELLRAGMVDLGFINLPLETRGDLEVRTLRPIQDCFVVSTRHFPLPDHPLTPAQLAGYPLLMLEGQSASRRYLDGWLEANGVTPQPEIQLGSLDLLVEFAKIGLGAAARPTSGAAAQLADGTLARLPLDPPIPPRAIGLVTHRSIPLSSAARRLIQLLPDGEGEGAGR